MSILGPVSKGSLWVDLWNLVKSLFAVLLWYWSCDQATSLHQSWQTGNASLTCAKYSYQVILKNMKKHMFLCYNYHGSWNKKTFHRKSVFENAICKIVSIVFWPQCVNKLKCKYKWLPFLQTKTASINQMHFLKEKFVFWLIFHWCYS